MRNRSQAIICGSVLIQPKEIFLDILHPYFNKIVADLSKMGNLPIVCEILGDYSDRFLEVGSESRI